MSNAKGVLIIMNHHTKLYFWSPFPQAHYARRAFCISLLQPSPWIASDVSCVSEREWPKERCVIGLIETSPPCHLPTYYFVGSSIETPYWHYAYTDRELLFLYKQTWFIRVDACSYISFDALRDEPRETIAMFHLPTFKRGATKVWIVCLFSPPRSA